jgi:type I restriction enzyme S subunit
MIAELKPYAAYKDSGLAWLGQVPEHWEVRRLRASITDCANGLWGSDPNGKEDLICIRVADFDRINLRVSLKRKTIRAIPISVRSRRLLRNGDLLLEKSGGGDLQPVGAVVSYDHDDQAVCSNFVARMPMADGYNSHYVKYLHSTLYAYRVNIRSIKQTTGIQNLDGKAYLSEQVAFPPFAEQAAIVRFLDWANGRLERTIRAKRRVIALLTEQKQAIIHRAVTRGLDPAVPLKPSGIASLGNIPQHWESQNLGRAIRLLTGFPFASSGFSLSETGMRLVRGINVTPSGLRWNSVVRWERKSGDRLNEFALQVGDIVLGMDRPIIGSGVRAAAIEEKDTPSLLLQRVARLRPTARLDAKFLLLLLRGRLFANYMTPIFTGISVPHLSPEQIKGFRVTLPPVNEQREIVTYVETETEGLNTTISRLKREIELLGEYRTRLVADVVTGKLDVREAAARLPQDANDPASEPDALTEDEDTDSDELAELES